MSVGIRTLGDLLDRCHVDEITGCWNWVGATTTSGSPSMWIPALNTVGSLGTLLSVLTTGERPGKGTCWVPACGNQLCCLIGATHRRLADQSELQKITRPTLTPLHRARITQGRRRISSLCTPEIAREIRGSSETLEQVAARTGMSESMASKIRRGEAWVELSPFTQWRVAA